MMRGRSLAGCVPILSDNRLCLITSRHNPEDLLFPKGSVKHGETDVEAAQRETLEEAGVEGRIVGDLGLFEGIHWFILRVDKIHDRWPEMQERARLFMAPDEALMRDDLKPVARSAISQLIHGMFNLAP